MPSRWDTVSVDGGAMRCYLALPEGAGPFPAVVVIQHAGGVDEFVQGMTDRFADAGYAAVSPELYHRETEAERGDDPLTRMGRLRDGNIVADAGAALEHVRGLPEVASERVAIAGFCMGGRVAYLVATQEPSLKAAAVFYGGNIMLPWGEGEAPFERTERIQCPVLGLFGEQDTNPSPADVAKIDAELSRLGKGHEFHSYAPVGHAFMNQARPGYNDEVAGDAWERCVAWLGRYV